MTPALKFEIDWRDRATHAAGKRARDRGKWVLRPSRRALLLLTREAAARGLSRAVALESVLQFAGAVRAENERLKVELANALRLIRAHERGRT